MRKRLSGDQHKIGFTRRVFARLRPARLMLNRVLMITNALLILLGLSSCATLMIVATVMLGARRSRVVCPAPSAESVSEAAANQLFASAAV